MSGSNVYADFSIKASFANLDEAQMLLLSQGARYVGEDFQTDTYFKVPIGKMKLREGNIEHLLTHYLREDEGGKMKTTVFLYEKNPSPEMVEKHTGNLLTLGKVVKRRRILFIDNVKFHLDRFENGRTFLEIEAIDRDGSLGLEHIRQQATRYSQLLGIKTEDISSASYIDML